MNIKAMLISILLIAMTVSLVANEPYRVGTTAANFLEMGVGGAANGMGDAYVAATRDLSSVYWNAAGLAYLETNEVQFSYQPWIADIDVAFIGGGVVIPRIGTLARSTGAAAGIGFGGSVVLLLLGSLPRVGQLMPGGLVAWAVQLGLGGDVTPNGGALVTSVVLIVCCVLGSVAALETQEL